MQITNNTFSSFPLYCTGIAIDNYSDILLENNTLDGPLVKGTGVYLNASSPRVIGNTIRSFKYGLACLNGSTPLLESDKGGGRNRITNNINAVFCDKSDAILGDQYGDNTICMNYGIDVHVNEATVIATNNHWASNGDPPGTFEIISGDLKYDPWGGSCGGASPIAGGKLEQGLDEGDPMMTPTPALVRQALRERRRGNHALTDALLRAIVVNGSISQEYKQWALGQVLAVGQRMRTGNLASFFSSLASSATLGRRAKALLPMSHLHEGSFTQAITAYDANYPSVSKQRRSSLGCARQVCLSTLQPA